MRLRKVGLNGRDVLAVKNADQWVALPALGFDGPESEDLIAFLQRGAELREQVQQRLQAGNFAPQSLDLSPRLPFEPRSYRDFMVYEEHAVNAMRGAIRVTNPTLSAQVEASIAGGTLPPEVKPKDIWYRQPIYYFGNHLNFYPDGAEIPWPSYTKLLDYELELGIILGQGGTNLSETEALACIGAFVVFNDWSGRDVQAEEMASGFGPQKAKNFANSMSAEVVTADELLPQLEKGLTAQVYVNGKLQSESSTRGAQHSLARMVSFASQGERLFPGELLGSGTLPGCCGLEIGKFLQPGDSVRLVLEKVGTLENQVGQTIGSYT